MSFLPKDYEAPAKGGNYTKFNKGTTRIRIMSDSITGYQDWKDNKPYNTKEQMPALTAERNPKHFRAFVVYNYDAQSIQVLQLTQKSIMDAIYNLYNDEDWGDPKQYDLKVTKTGDGMETKYALTTGQKTAVDPKIAELYKKTPVNLNALYDGTDPFTTAEDEAYPF